MRQLLFKLFGVSLLMGSLFIGWLWMHYQSFTESELNTGGMTMTIQVRPGSSLKKVAKELEQKRVITDARLFVWMARLRGEAQNIQAGEYRIDSGMTPADLLKNMVTGKVTLHGMTIVEGWNFTQLMQAINENELLVHTLAGLNSDEIMQRIGKPGDHPEGRFLPNTYHFPRGMSDVSFLQRAWQAMDELLAREWADRDEGLPLETPYEALTLASIVEKETGLASERPDIAGVFVRRLHKGMRLQTDPTVIYGLGSAYDGNIRRQDLKHDTPYNTYTRNGLPPTPIAMPGGEAIRAALHPAEGDSLYFVSKGDGSHHFSSTLDEHNNAVIKYQLKGKKRSFSSNP
jgi:UPF0755 protein